MYEFGRTQISVYNCKSGLSTSNVNIIIFSLVGHEDNFQLATKQQAYACDITYGTNNEFGFDYLRDNMSVEMVQRVQRERNYAIVDEVDNILIDEARTPLIISGPAEEPVQHYYTFAKLVPRFNIEEDYTIDERTQAISLTPEATEKMEKLRDELASLFTVYAERDGDFDAVLNPDLRRLLSETFPELHAAPGLERNLAFSVFLLIF